MTCPKSHSKTVAEQGLVFMHQVSALTTGPAFLFLHETFVGAEASSDPGGFSECLLPDSHQELLVEMELQRVGGDK